MFLAFDQGYAVFLLIGYGALLIVFVALVIAWLRK